MASKVNTKFVVILTASVLTLFAGVAGLGYYVINKTGSTWERRGDRLAAKGDYAAAAIAYGRAVGHEKNNVAWLKKWDDALAHWAPPTENEFNEAYSKFHLTILQQIATSLQTDAEAHRVFLDAMYREFSYGNSRTETWEQMANMASSTLERLDISRPDVQRLLRYRGLAQLQRIRNLEAKDDEWNQPRKDLEQAVAADPTDMESKIGLVEWQVLDAARTRRGGDVEKSDAQMKAAKATLQQLVAQNPDDPRPAMRLWDMTTEETLAKAVNAVEQRKTRDAVAPGLDPIIATTKRAPATIVDTMFLRKIGQRIIAARPADGAGVWLGLIDEALAKDPNNSALMVIRGQALAQLDEGDKAIAQYQAIIDKPDPPVTFEGKLLRDNRKLAMQLATECTLAKWERADVKDKPALMAEVKKRRDALGDRVGANHPALLRINALLAVTEMRFSEAVKHLSDLNNLTGGQDIETLYLLAYALKGEGSLGGAVQQYDRILQLDKGQLTALLNAAEIELRLEQIDNAQKRLEAVLALDPENETAKREMQLVKAVKDPGTKDMPTTDPTVRDLLAANKALTGAEPDPAKAAEILDKGLRERPDDYRLINQRVILHVQQGTIEPAIALVQNALTRSPTSAQLKQLLTFLQVKDPIEQQERMIAETDASPLDKKLQLYVMYRTNGKPEKASPLLAEAVKEAPDDIRVVEYQFVEAIEAKRMDEARALAGRAAQLNIDQVGGLMFQARLEMVEGKLDAALSTLGRATQQLPLSAPAWRLTGQAQSAAGRVEAALEAFKKAVQLRPNDVMMTKPYLSTLMALGRKTEALELLREAKNRNAADDQMVGLWLELEEQVGDKAKALDVRKRIMNSRPQDRSNRIAVARLELWAKDWDAATKVIDSLRADEPLAGALLEARMLALRDDPEGARTKIAAFVESTSDNTTKLEALLGLCETLLEFGRDDQAFVALRDARAYQDAKLMQADRRLGDALFDKGRNEEAVDSYTRILAAGADKDNVVGKRRAEALLRLQKWDEAAAAVNEIEKKSKRDFQTLMLLADAASGKGDKRAAEQFLDEAVTTSPTNPMGFFRRAALHESDPDQFALVIKDLDKAISLRPDFMLARTRKASLLFQKGRDSDAIAVLSDAVEAVPDDDGMRLSYIQQLLRLRRYDDAKIAVTEAAKARGAAQPAWFVHAGDIYSGTGDFKGALEYYRKGYDAKPGFETVGHVVDALLHQAPPAGAEAMKAIDALPKDIAEQFKSGLLILRARVHGTLGKDADAQKAMAEAWPLVRTAPGQVRAWFEQLDIIMKREIGRIEKFVQQVATEQEPLGAAGTVMLAERVARDPKRWPEALQMLNGIETKTRDMDTLIEVHRTRAQIMYFSERYDDAVACYKAGLAIAPNNPEFNNNLAYTLARDLNKPEEALGFAQKAAVLDPSNASVLDTLGWLQMKAKQLNPADETFSRALNLASQSNEKLPILIHMAELKFRQGDSVAARDLLERAKAVGKDDPNSMKSNQAEFDAVNKMINGAQ